jgi:hypothetical protein
MIPHKRHFALHGLTAITLLVPVLLFYYFFKVNIVTHETAVPIWVDDDKMQHALDSHKRDYTTIKLRVMKNGTLSKCKKLGTLLEISLLQTTLLKVCIFILISILNIMSL